MANQYTKTEIDIEQIIALYQSGATQVEIAELMGVSQKIIWHRLKESKVKCRMAAPRNQKGINNNNWKGDDVGYAAFHKRLETQKGRPKKCEECGTTEEKRTYDWANLNGRYNDPSDYKRLCRSCHWKYDGTINNIKHMRKEDSREEA